MASTRRSSRRPSPRGVDRASAVRRLGLLLCAVAAGVLVPASPAAATAQSFVATLVGSQEVGPTGSPATGNGTVALNAAETQITVNANFVNLVAPSIAGHIHANVAPAPAPPGTNAPVRFDFGTGWTGAPNGAIGPQMFAVTPARGAPAPQGQMYFNIHSTVFAGGEIRGQIVTSASYPATAGAVGVNPSTTWNMRNALTTGGATNTFDYGTRPNVPFVCDLNGDGDETPVSYEAGSFKVRHTNTAGPPDLTIPFGDPRGFPVGGDFDGDARDDLAVYRNGTWQVRYTDDGAVDTFSVRPGRKLAQHRAGERRLERRRRRRDRHVHLLHRHVEPAPHRFVRRRRRRGVRLRDGEHQLSGRRRLGSGQRRDRRRAGRWREPSWLLRNFNNAGTANTTFDFGLANALPLSWRGAAIPPGP